MIEWFRNLFKNKKTEKDFGIELEGWGGLGINNLVVSEFNYLFQYILSKQDTLDKNMSIRDVDNFKLISENINLLTTLIDEELSLDKLREEECYNISHDTAIRNMKHMRNILISISNWMNYKKENY
jgi:hypothetical protein